MKRQSSDGADDEDDVEAVAASGPCGANRSLGLLSSVYGATMTVGEDAEKRDNDDIEESAYSGAFAMLMRDSVHIARGSHYALIRYTRMLTSMLILWLLIAIQLYLLIQIKTFVTSPAVQEIRTIYADFEHTMYDGHVKDTGYGFKVGIGGTEGPHFNPARFKDLSDSVRSAACLIPFSQLHYLRVILFIWALSIAGELRVCFNQMRWILCVKSAPLAEATAEDDDGNFIVNALPNFMKVLMTTLLVLPRALIACVLLWLGCRWLSATLSFADVLVNAIALEFVVGLNMLIYYQLMSNRNQRDVRNTKLCVRHEDSIEPQFVSFFGGLIWVVLAFGWVEFYLNYFQMVLPGYNWDVKGVCADWIASRFDFWRL